MLNLSQPYLQSLKIETPNSPFCEDISAHFCAGTSKSLSLILPRSIAPKPKSKVALSLIAVSVKIFFAIVRRDCHSISLFTLTISEPQLKEIIFVNVLLSSFCVTFIATRALPSSIISFETNCGILSGALLASS